MSVLHRKCRSRDGKPLTLATNGSPNTMPPSRAHQIRPHPRHKILSRRLTRWSIYMWKAGGERGDKEEKLEKMKYTGEKREMGMLRETKGQADPKIASKAEGRKTNMKKDNEPRVRDTDIECI